MIHCWKSGKQKTVYDTASGAVLTFSSLEYKMIQAITPPLAPLCPSSLRYELAKYDSADVEEAYDKIYALFRDGILFAKDQNDTVSLRVGGPYGLISASETAREAIAFLNGRPPKLIVTGDIDQKIVEDISALF